MSSRPNSPGRSADDPPPDLSGEEDADLLTYMTMREEFPAHAREAWAELYRRHCRYVFCVCRRALDRWARPPTGPEELTQEVFLKVFDRAGTYCQKAGQSPDERRRSLRAWIGTIAQNLLRDLLRGRPRDVSEVLLDSEQLEEQPAPESNTGDDSSELVAVVNELMDTVLDEREREVLRATFQHYVPGRKNQRLPNRVAEELARGLNTTSENLRKIRQRAIEKLTVALERRLGPMSESA